MGVSEAARLKALEDENDKLKRLLADTMLENFVLKDLLGNQTPLQARRTRLPKSNPQTLVMNEGPPGCRSKINAIKGTAQNRDKFKYYPHRTVISF